MKNKLMERPFFNGIIRQRIDNQMLCLSDLDNMYEKLRVENGWREKQLSKFFENKDEIEYVVELLDLQGVFIESKKLLFIEQVDNQGLLKTLKSIGKYEMKGRGENRRIFCDPYIFVAIAQWMNPRFRAYVTMWVTDSLILDRIDAGVMYKDLSTSIKDNIIPNLSDNGKRFIFSNIAKLVNKKIFGRHEDNLRQMASKDQLRQLQNTELVLSEFIKAGVLNNYQEIKEYLNNIQKVL